MKAEKFFGYLFNGYWIPQSPLRIFMVLCLKKQVVPCAYISITTLLYMRLSCFYKLFRVIVVPLR